MVLQLVSVWDTVYPSGKQQPPVHNSNIKTMAASHCETDPQKASTVTQDSSRLQLDIKKLINVILCNFPLRSILIQNNSNILHVQIRDKPKHALSMFSTLHSRTKFNFSLGFLFLVLGFRFVCFFIFQLFMRILPHCFSLKFQKYTSYHTFAFHGG